MDKFRHAFNVASTFEIPKRGLAITADTNSNNLPSWVTLYVGDKMEIRTGEQVLKAKVGGIELPCTDDVTFFVSDLTKELVPIGSEIWLSRNSRSKIISFRLNVEGETREALEAWECIREKLAIDFPFLKEAKVVSEPYPKFPGTQMVRAAAAFPGKPDDVQAVIRLLGGKEWSFSTVSEDQWAVWDSETAGVDNLHGAKWLSVELFPDPSGAFQVTFGSPQHGWLPLEVAVGDDSASHAVSDVPDDTLFRLVNALNLLAKGSDREEVEWHLEPDYWCWTFSGEPGTISFKAADPLGKTLETTLERNLLIRIFARELGMLKANPAWDKGDKAWSHGFPDAEFSRLEELTRMV